MRVPDPPKEHQTSRYLRREKNGPAGLSLHLPSSLGSFVCHAAMTTGETQEILKWVDAALDVYRRNEGRLSAFEIRMKSMLSVIRSELLTELNEQARVSSKE